MKNPQRTSGIRALNESDFFLYLLIFPLGDYKIGIFIETDSLEKCVFVQYIVCNSKSTFGMKKRGNHFFSNISVVLF